MEVKGRGTPEAARSGPLPVSRAPLDTWPPLHLALRDAALALGYGWADDHNAPESTGVSPGAGISVSCFPVLRPHHVSRHAT
jgi:choline dehydrogenase